MSRGGSHPDAVLVASRVEKRYGGRGARGVQALAGVDLQVRRGEALGLLGPNGAGKSTLVKSICGLVHPTAGSIAVAGHRAGSRAARRRVGYLAELFRFPPWLTVDEALGLQQRLARSPGGSRERTRLLELVELDHVADRRVAALSKGMQQRLGIAQAIVGEPPLVVLDEPTSALDPAGRRMVRDLVRDLCSQDRAVLLSSHLLAEVEQTCVRVAILDRGLVQLDERVERVVAPLGVEVETSAGLRVYEGVARAGVPRLVEQLVTAGDEVYGVRMLASTLEDTYLALVRQAEEAHGR